MKTLLLNAVKKHPYFIIALCGGVLLGAVLGGFVGVIGTTGAVMILGAAFSAASDKL